MAGLFPVPSVAPSVRSWLDTGPALGLPEPCRAAAAQARQHRQHRQPRARVRLLPAVRGHGQLHAVPPSWQAPTPGPWATRPPKRGCSDVCSCCKTRISQCHLPAHRGRQQHRQTGTLEPLPASRHPMAHPQLQLMTGAAGLTGTATPESGASASVPSPGELPVLPIPCLSGGGAGGSELPQLTRSSFLLRKTHT